LEEDSRGNSEFPYRAIRVRRDGRDYNGDRAFGEMDCGVLMNKEVQIC